MSEKVINRIRKLFALAEGATKIGSQAEAEAAAAMAHKLLLEHKLDMATIERAQLDLEDPMETRNAQSQEWGQRETKSRQMWSEQLASIVAKAHFCRTAVNYGSNEITFYGRTSDIEVAIFVFTWLARTAARLAREEMRSAKAQYLKVKPRWSARRTHHSYVRVKTKWRHKFNKTLWPGDRRFVESFHEGFRLAIYTRYRKQREAAETNDDNALVLFRSDADAAAYADDKTRPARGLKKQRTHEHALGLGWLHGHEVNLDLKGLQPTSKPVGLLES